MGRAIAALGQKLAEAEVARLSGVEAELVREVADSDYFVELAQVAGSMGNPDSAARPAPFRPKKPAPKPGDVRMRDMKTAKKPKPKAPARKPKQSGGGGSDSEFERLHPRNPDGTFAYKEDTGKGAAGIGTKDKGLPSGKPDGEVHGRISEAQKELVRLGFLKSTDGTQGEAVDGFFGQYTQSALRRYQQDKGLKVTGQIDEATAKALGLKETGGAKSTAKTTTKKAAKMATSKKESSPEPVPAQLQTAIELLRELLAKQRVDVKLSGQVVDDSVHSYVLYPPHRRVAHQAQKAANLARQVVVVDHEGRPRAARAGVGSAPVGDLLAETADPPLLEKESVELSVSDAVLPLEGSASTTHPALIGDFDALGALSGSLLDAEAAVRTPPLVPGVEVGVGSGNATDSTGDGTFVGDGNALGVHAPDRTRFEEAVVSLTKFTEAQRDRLAGAGAAMPSGGFPIRNESDLRNAIQAYGRAKDKAAAKRHIMKRARALGLTKLLPESWTSTVSLAGQDVVELATAKGTLDWSPKKNWVDDEGGLPKYIEKIALALVRGGHPRSRAIAIAISRCKRWAAGGENVNADTRAKAAAAIAQWEKMKASAHARPNKD